MDNYRVILSYLSKVSRFELTRDLGYKGWGADWSEGEDRHLERFKNRHWVNVDYKEDDALDNYGSYNGFAVNHYLRTGEFPEPDEDGEIGEGHSESDIRRTVEGLDSALSKAIVHEDVVVWRGMLWAADHVLCKKIAKLSPYFNEGGLIKGSSPRDVDISLRGLVGFEYTEPTFLSTSVNRAIGKRFLRGQGVGILLRIHVPEGANGFYLPSKAPSGGLEKYPGYFIDQDEIILPRGSRFKVNSVSFTQPAGINLSIDLVV